ncbi:MAG: VOC family protein [Xanthobacteraceae bacterium]
MPLQHVLGLDHVVVTTRNLDAAGATWRKLGFTLSPRGTHSPHIGSANYTIVFGDDYIELLGILTETPHNRLTTAFLKQREGIERAAFTTDDAVAGLAELTARGISGSGPLAFARPVELPGGGTTEARFNTFNWPAEDAPAGLRIFACQHLTPDAVWIPALRHHPNGATRLAAVEIVAADPRAAAAQLSRLIDRPVESKGDGSYRVASGGNRADFLFHDAAAFARRYPEHVREGAPGEGAAALSIATDDMAKARGIAGTVAHDGALSVPAAQASGVIVSFVDG